MVMLPNEAARYARFCQICQRKLPFQGNNANRGCNTGYIGTFYSLGNTYTACLVLLLRKIGIVDMDHDGKHGMFKHFCIAQ